MSPIPLSCVIFVSIENIEWEEGRGPLSIRHEIARHTESEWDDGRMRTEFESSRGVEGEIDRERDGDTLSSDGTIERGGRETEFETERERQGDSVVTEGTITGENRSAELDSVREDGEAAIRVEGSEGSTGEFRRELDDGEISGSGTITRDGKTIETDTTRSAEGVQRELETSEGGQGAVARQGDERAFVGESGSGDVYAGRDGEVYKKGDDGWSKVENPRSGAATGASTRDGSASTLSTTQRQQLERDSRSRARGFERYGSYQRSRPAGRRGGRPGGR